MGSMKSRRALVPQSDALPIELRPPNGGQATTLPVAERRDARGECPPAVADPRKGKRAAAQLGDASASRATAAPETWRPVVGYEGTYEVSDRGRVRRVGKAAALKPKTMWRGYREVHLHMNGAGKVIRVHKIVAAAFIGPCPAGFTVDHLDGDKRNNAASNLEYVGRLENFMRHVRRQRARRELVENQIEARIEARAARAA